MKKYIPVAEHSPIEKARAQLVRLIVAMNKNNTAEIISCCKNIIKNILEEK